MKRQKTQDSLNFKGIGKGVTAKQHNYLKSTWQRFAPGDTHCLWTTVHTQSGCHSSRLSTRVSFEILARLFQHSRWWQGSVLWVTTGNKKGWLYSRKSNLSMLFGQKKKKKNNSRKCTVIWNRVMRLIDRTRFINFNLHEISQTYIIFCSIMSSICSPL